MLGIRFTHTTSLHKQSEFPWLGLRGKFLAQHTLKTCETGFKEAVNTLLGCLVQLSTLLSGLACPLATAEGTVQEQALMGRHMPTYQHTILETVQTRLGARLWCTEPACCWWTSNLREAVSIVIASKQAAILQGHSHCMKRSRVDLLQLQISH